MTSHRVADKYCLGNSDLVGTNDLLSNGGRVQNYLGGIDTIAIYKNGSNITNLGKPTVIHQKTKLKRWIYMDMAAWFRQNPDGKVPL
mgnify:CR=1 FL=1